MRLDDWFLGPDERGNPATRLRPWTTGNEVTPLVHGAEYFPRLVDAVNKLKPGDLFCFTDWQGDVDEELADGTTVGDLIGGAAERGVIVRGLVWRSHSEKQGFTERENRQVGDRANEAGGEVLLDERVRRGGSHHQKLVVLRPADYSDDAVAFVGGIDLCNSRRDDDSHAGDPQSQPMSAPYGERPPWHDVQAQVRGPAVADLDITFRERWDDPAPLDHRNPVRLFFDLAHGIRIRPKEALPGRRPDPAPVGTHAVQVLRTYGDRSPGWGTRPGGARLPTRVLSRIRRPSYPFAPDGERSIARAYRKVFGRAQRLIYIEDQYLWSKEVANLIAEAMRNSPNLHVVAVVPRYPDQDGRFSLPPNLIGRRQAVEVCRQVDPDRISVFDVVNPAGTPVYVHAKVCIVDDVWATIGSDNMNRRSWTHDSELNVAVIDDTRDQREPVDLTGRGDGARVFARDLRLRLWREHLDWDDARDGGLDRLVDPSAGIAELRRRADRLEDWYRTAESGNGEKGERPPGRLRPHQPEELSWFTRAWATPVYRSIYDPDGRPLGLRRAHDW